MWKCAALLTMALMCWASALPCQAEEPTTNRLLRVLLTYGGHDFEQKQFFAMFDNLAGVKYTRAPMPASAGLLSPGLEKEYDVIVMYDMVSSISNEQQNAFMELLRTGIGVVSLHHNLGAHSGWDEYAAIIGGRYFHKPAKIDGKEYRASAYAHDQDMEIRIADKTHPVTQGISDFRIHDEGYQHYYTAPGAHVLLTTEHPQSDRAIAWSTRYGKSPVLYLLLGHDAAAWQNPVYPKLLLNGIRWAADALEMP